MQQDDQQPVVSGAAVPEGGATPEPAPAMSVAAAPGLWQGAGAMLWYLALQVAFGAGVAAVIGVLYGTEEVNSRIADVGLMGGALSAVSMLLIFWLKLRNQGAAYRAAVGWGPAAREFGPALLLVAQMFILIRLFSGLYAIAFLSEGDLQGGAAEEIIAATNAAGGTLQLVLTWVFMALVGPIAEEFVFRGYLQSSLERRFGAAVAIGVASACFATFHFQLTLWPLYFIMGAGFGVTFHLTRSIWPAILLHMLNNIFALAVQYSGWTQGAP